jgi:hypothetical protein
MRSHQTDFRDPRSNDAQQSLEEVVDGGDDDE